MIEKSGVLINFPVNKDPRAVTSVANPGGVQMVRVKSINIEPLNPTGDQEQYGRVTTSVAPTEISFEVIARTAEQRGDKVTRFEADVPLKPGWENRQGEVIQAEGKIVAWRKTEQITINTLPTSTPDQISNQQVALPTSAQSREVVEIIGVSSPQDPKLEKASTHDEALLTNPYLKKTA